MRHILWISLSSLGITNVKFAKDGTEALNCMLTNDFDIVLCDLAMTPIGGIELIRRIRESTHSHYFDVPIIVVTGHADRKNILEARDVGATEFLAKPITIENLWRRIEHVIENPRAFLNIDDYVGPDRRRRSGISYDGHDRRSNGQDGLNV